MVSVLLIAAALIAAPLASEGGSGARAEAVATATIVHAVVVQGSTATARDTAAQPMPLTPRPCEVADPRTDCRLIVFDLP